MIDICLEKEYYNSFIIKIKTLLNHLQFFLRANCYLPDTINFPYNITVKKIVIRLYNL